jgi:hypothetical protein
MMKIDAYTRIVLTVIACTLVIFVIQNAVDMRKAVASGVTRVAICDESGQYCVDVVPSTNGLGQDTGVRMGVLSLQG